MPLQVVEAVAGSGRYTRTRAAPTRYTCTPKKGIKSLMYKHSIIVLIFQGTQRKAYKYICLMLAAGTEPVKPQQAKKGADCTPLKLPKFYISAVSAVMKPHARSVTDA